MFKSEFFSVIKHNFALRRAATMDGNPTPNHFNSDVCIRAIELSLILLQTRADFYKA